MRSIIPQPFSSLLAVKLKLNFNWICQTSDFLFNCCWKISMRFVSVITSQFITHIFHVFETTKHNLRLSKTRSNAIQWTAFGWVWLLNPVEHNLMDWVRLDLLCSIEFDWFGNGTPPKFSVWFCLIGDLNWIQSTDLIWLSFWFPNIWLSMPGMQGFSPSLNGVFCVALSKTEIWWQGPWQWIRFKLFWIWRWWCTGKFCDLCCLFGFHMPTASIVLWRPSDLPYFFD